MSRKPDNPPAFPHNSDLMPGMTLRDYFAATVIGPSVMATLRGGSPESVATDIFVAARAAYRIADAMLAEREKQT